mmetsp:Transcript_91179/g.294729  ORF Transcript_91179/g.294729 Transcript_91179/m.294729 type:complete len:232 (+) Transcript_91179:463-1158(+)
MSDLLVLQLRRLLSLLLLCQNFPRVSVVVPGCCLSSSSLLRLLLLLEGKLQDAVGLFEHCDVVLDFSLLLLGEAHLRLEVVHGGHGLRVRHGDVAPPVSQVRELRPLLHEAHLEVPLATELPPKLLLLLAQLHGQLPAEILGVAVGVAYGGRAAIGTAAAEVGVAVAGAETAAAHAGGEVARSSAGAEATCAAGAGAEGAHVPSEAATAGGAETSTTVEHGWQGALGPRAI